MASSHKSAEACPDCANYACGVVAGLVNVFFTFPINKVIFRQQIESVRFHVAVKQVGGEFLILGSSVLDLSQLLQVHQEGLWMLYRGIAPPLCQKSVQIGLMYGCFQTYYRVHKL